MNHGIVDGRFRTVRLIGAGGMGSVYEAIDTRSGQRVALKLVTAEVARDEVLMSRFEREARAAMTIETPHIVRTYATGRDDQTGLPYTVMEYLEGEDGRQLFKRCGPIAPDLALRITAQACIGLQMAHERGVIHRDIKPANFFLTAAPRGERVVKLLDFGIAKLRRDPNEADTAETAGLTMTGSILGSPLYMSPEQARGRKDIDFRADIWSLGIVLYQALSGRTPFQDSDALGELLVTICTEPPEPVQNLAPWVAPEIAAIVDRALRMNPADRFQTAGEMYAALRALLPSGHEITDLMLRPISDGERSVVAPRASVAPQIPPPTRSQTSYAPSSPMGYGAIGLETPHALTSTAGAAATSRAAPQEGRGRVGFAVVGAVVALSVGGLAAYAVIKRGPEPSVAAAAPAKSADARGEQASANSIVKVVIIPDTADVEIDGLPTKPKDGIIEITGPLGSVHRFRAVASGSEATGEVVITASGAIPPKIEVASKPGAAASVGRPKVPALGPPQATTKPKPSATPPPPSDIFIKR